MIKMPGTSNFLIDFVLHLRTQAKWYSYLFFVFFNNVVKSLQGVHILMLEVRAFEKDSLDHLYEALSYST